MTPELPLTRDLVFVGGGHAHALALRRWGMRPLPGARLTLIDPDPVAAYTGMLPGHIAGHYRREELEIDLVRLARFAGARLILGRVESIDRERRRVRIAGRGEIAYDLLSLDIGVTAAMPELPGFAEHGVPAKPLDRFADAWDRLVADGATGAVPVVVIGGGIGGSELAMAMAFRLRKLGASPAVTVIDRDRAFAAMPERARHILLKRMRGLGITLREHTTVAEVGADAVRLEDGATLPSVFTVGAAGPRPHGWLAETGLMLEDGYVAVGPTLQSVNDAAVFAAGDCAHLTHAPRPKAGVFAVRAASWLHDNLRATLTGRPLRRFRPQRDYLKLVSLGRRAALAERGGRSLAGRPCWWLKNRIDRRFVRRFTVLPVMPRPPLPEDLTAGVREALHGGKPMCGGCGAKVGGATLAAMLGALPAAAREDVLSRPGDDAAILLVGGQRQVITTDHLRAFTLDPWVMARIAAIHAMGDVWAMGARPQAALATIILPRMDEAMQARWLGEIMEAASAAFAAEGAAIVGGHTTLGDELTIGFTVTGLCEGEPVSIGGARPGDALILTKPLGSGTLLAAEMAREARGRWVAGALEAMQQGQGRAAARLAEAHAMTDVTGFGLAGHLLAMLQASGAAARLDLHAIPLLEGAEALAAAGIRSTLYPANRAAARAMSLPDEPRAALLFDPQTAGGLLAAVPADAAEALLAGLHADGYPAARMGEVVEGEPFIEVA